MIKEFLETAATVIAFRQNVKQAGAENVTRSYQGSGPLNVTPVTLSVRSNKFTRQPVCYCTIQKQNTVKHKAQLRQGAWTR